MICVDSHFHIQLVVILHSLTHLQVTIATCVALRVRGYQFEAPESFTDRSIDTYYVHGVSITYGMSPRKHIWSYSVGTYENRSSYICCPCNNGSTGFIPSFVGDDYYCESGVSSNSAQSVFYMLMIYYGMERTVMDWKIHVVLIQKCHGFSSH